MEYPGRLLQNPPSRAPLTPHSLCLGKWSMNRRTHHLEDLLQVQVREAAHAAPTVIRLV